MVEFHRRQQLASPLNVANSGLRLAQAPARGSNESRTESSPWGFLQWVVAGLASIGASATAFVWHLMTRLHTLEIAVRQHQHDLDVSQSANEFALLRLAERLALLHDDHYRLRETIGGLPS